MSEKDDLRKTMDAARRRLRVIEEAEAEAGNRALVGRTFRYRNCYSMPEKPSDYWWIWRVVESTDGYGLRVRDFWVDKDGRFGMERDKFCVGVRDWEEVSVAKWRAALRSYRAKVNAWLDATESTP